GTEATMTAAFQAWRGQKSFFAGGAIGRGEFIELGMPHHDGRDGLGAGLDRLRLQDCENDGLDAEEEFGERMASRRGVKRELSVDDVLVIIRVKRENANTNAELKVDDMDDVADADDQISRAEGAGDGRKRDALFEVILSAWHVEERVDIGKNRPQEIFD